MWIELLFVLIAAQCMLKFQFIPKFGLLSGRNLHPVEKTEEQHLCKIKRRGALMIKGTKEQNQNFVAR